METLEAAKHDNEIIALVSLLAMGIKSVPRPVLRKKFADSGPILMSLLEQFVDNENQNALRSVSLRCLRTLSTQQLILLISLMQKITDYWMHFGHFARRGICRLVDTIASKTVQSGAEFCDAHQTEDS